MDNLETECCARLFACNLSMNGILTIVFSKKQIISRLKKIEEKKMKKLEKKKKFI